MTHQNHSFSVEGYEDMELSTQLVIKEALKRGLSVEILDRADHFIRIGNGQKCEYLRQGNQSSLDHMITHFILNNKLVQKKLLQEKNLSTPKMHDYTKPDEAIKAFPLWEGKPIVIKPKSTNFGIGVQILNHAFDEEAYRSAIEAAFAEDEAILVEDFIAGEEYRFLVIDGTCLAVLNRMPANVVGDGTQSIEALVKEKNQDPWRGKGYRTPLEYIELGPTELNILKKSGLSKASVPKANERIFLRENSNISTGGDSLDQTDHMHDSYKTIAIEATQAMGAKVCGVDMIVQDINQAAKSENHGIIELNWNPVMYFHDFPYEGENRHVEVALLDALGF